MGTSDLHSNALNWDYYKDAAYSDSQQNAIGLARVSSVVNQIRADRGREPGDGLGRRHVADHRRAPDLTGQGLDPVGAAGRAEDVEALRGQATGGGRADAAAGAGHDG